MIWVRQNIAHPNNERNAAQALKVPDPNWRATSQGTTCPQKVKRRLLQKLTQKTKHHVLWIDPLPHLLQLSPSPTWTSSSKWWPGIDRQRQSCSVPANWPSKIAMLGLRWCDCGLELTFSDYHTWPPRSYHDLELAVERRPYLVLSNAATTSNWSSKIAMLGFRTVITISSWPQKGGHIWFWITWQRPRISSHRQPCMVPENHRRKSWFMTYNEFKLFWVLTVAPLKCYASARVAYK